MATSGLTERHIRDRRDPNAWHVYHGRWIDLDRHGAILAWVSAGPKSDADARRILDALAAIDDDTFDGRCGTFCAAIDRLSKAGRRFRRIERRLETAERTGRDSSACIDAWDRAYAAFWAALRQRDQAQRDLITWLSLSLGIPATDIEITRHVVELARSMRD